MAVTGVSEALDELEVLKLQLREIETKVGQDIFIALATRDADTILMLKPADQAKALDELATFASDAADSFYSKWLERSRT